MVEGARVAARRATHLEEFYERLTKLEARLGGKRLVSGCHGRMEWPTRGVYFFFEESEKRHRAEGGWRVVRVGTHALKPASGTKLWGRLAQHRGTATGSGNHRGSIFRLLVGDALIRRDGRSASSWGVAGTRREAAARLGFTTDEVGDLERSMEQNVSAIIGGMRLLWIDVDDVPSPTSLRGYIERNSIALLSNQSRAPLDPASNHWLGKYSGRPAVRASGLWNNNHVGESYDPDFLKLLR